MILVQHVPSWFPGAGFKRDAKAWRQLAFEARDMPWRAMKDSMVSFQPYVHPSFPQTRTRPKGLQGHHIARTLFKT